MDRFPETLDYTGLNTPVGEEYDIESLDVDGDIPGDVEGSFFRAVPDPAFPPYMEDGGAIISGDGMISAFRFEGGKASCGSLKWLIFGIRAPGSILILRKKHRKKPNTWFAWRWPELRHFIP